MGKNKRSFLKVVYFDEGSAMDYLEAKHGGRYDKISTDIIQKVKNIAGEIGVEASNDPKILSFIIDSIIGIKGKISGNASYSRTGNNQISETISSTVLSNFIEDVYDINKNEKKERQIKRFGIFDNVSLSFIPNSITYLKIISPMLKIINEESFGNDMPIQLSALDQIFNDAKGYYELVSIGNEKEPEKVFRFNFNALRNNYRLNDLTKMNITIIGIKVGECEKEELNWESEFGDKKVSDHNSAFENMLGKEGKIEDNTNVNKKKLSIYDVILAGVVSDED